jgi:hypothetical protein
MKAAIDNDILYKGACYGLLDELIATSCSKTEAPGVLGSARFVVPMKIEKGKLRRDSATALANFFEFLRRTEALEPTENEQNLAADLEFAAQKSGISLDSGESQLCSILVQRMLLLLLTGDKRAIAAIEKLLDDEPRLIPICGKVRCLEQLVSDALVIRGHATVRSAVCSEPDIDKALAICFSCTNESVLAESLLEGLQSYIRSLRTDASRVLSP